MKVEKDSLDYCWMEEDGLEGIMGLRKAPPS